MVEKVIARNNPFRVDCVQTVRYRLPLSRDHLYLRLESLNYRAAIVGPEGSGKTTLLYDIFRQLRGAGIRVYMLRMHADDQFLTKRETKALFRSLEQDCLVFFDGADHLTSSLWKLVLRESGRLRGLIITSHQPGLLPTLIETETTPELLQGIVRDLLGSETDFTEQEAQRLFSACSGNIRDALRLLYDNFAEGSGVVG
ncbi:MAG TPA: AAA family ATPase [Phycisphaeraceae bacterium]|nr:AAA family ATPase [Phycisphaeraceae bacterium]